MASVNLEEGVAAQRPKLLDQVRGKLRLERYSRRTEAVYIDWIRRFILFHSEGRDGKTTGETPVGHTGQRPGLRWRHPEEMGADECVRLRIKDVDFGYLQITVREAKGGRDRVTMVPGEPDGRVAQSRWRRRPESMRKI